jgi:hypothetical protein
MKKTLLLFALLAAFGCKKETITLDLGNLDYFAFGTAYGFCAGDACVTLFQLQGQNLYPDADVTKQQFFAGDITFQTTSLPADKVALAQDLLAKFPPALLDESEEHIGCPDCSDQGTIFVEIKESSTVRRWRIDPFLDKYKPFSTAVANTVHELK